MITTTSAKKSVSAVRFADMIPGKLYRFTYGRFTSDGFCDSEPSSVLGSVLGVAGVTMTKHKTFTILDVKQGSVARCADKVGSTWTGISMKEFFRADDVTVAINNESN